MASLFFDGETMSDYSFLKNSKLYIVRGTSRYKLEIYPDLSFSQTVEEQQRSVKTLHEQHAMFDAAIINKANPADLSFTVLLVEGNDFKVVGDWLTTLVGTTSDRALETYDVFVDTGVHIFKIHKAVLTSATIQLQKGSLITVSLQATASKLSRFGPSGTALPGSAVPRDPLQRAAIPRWVSVERSGVPVGNISSITVEVRNDVNWIEYDTLHKSLYVTSPSETQVPEDFVVSGRTLSGTIARYLTEAAEEPTGWSIGESLRIRVGDGATTYLDVNLPATVITKALGVGDVYSEFLTFRMTHNPTSLADVFIY